MADGVTEHANVEQSWSDPKKWWMDLLKSVIAFAFISGLSLLVLSKYDDMRQRDNFAW